MTFARTRSNETRQREASVASAAAAVGETVLSSTPDYTVTSGAASGTQIWKWLHIPGWGRIFVLRSTQLAANIDTIGALDSANIPGSELTLGDWFLAKTNADQSPFSSGAAGVFILDSFTDGTPATNIDVKNLQGFGFANTD